MAEALKIESIQLKRGTKAKLEAYFVGENLPLAGEPIYETDTHRLKVGDGVSTYADLPYVGDTAVDVNTAFLPGYYLNGEFYTDSTYTTKLIKSNISLYLDCNTATFYKYYGESVGFKSIYVPVVEATDTTAGVMKLYKTSGANEDGTMTQKAITDGVQAIKFAVEKVDTDNNGILDENDENCLILELPWTSAAE